MLDTAARYARITQADVAARMGNTKQHKPAHPL